MAKKKDIIETLYEGCRNGDRAAQERLYQHTSQAMLSLCLRYTENLAEAEDVLQTGYIRVFTHIHSYQQRGSFEGWIRKIMVNTAIEAYRRRKRILQWTGIDRELEEMVATPHSDPLEYEDIIRMIRELPDGYRMVFNMFAMEGYSHKEIAETLGISENTSKTQLLRARQWLKNRMNYQEGEIYETR